MTGRLLLCGLLVAVALPGCMTFNVSPRDAEPAPNSIVSSSSASASGTSLTIRRDSGLFGVACDHTIRIDGKFVGNLRPGEQVVLHPEPGDRTIEVSMSGNFCNPQSAGASAHVEAGLPRVFRTGLFGAFTLVVQPAPDDLLRAPGTAVPVTPAAAPARAASSASPRPAAVGESSRDVERMREAMTCSPAPHAELLAKGPGFESYRVVCSGGDNLLVRCEFGNCRVLR